MLRKPNPNASNTKDEAMIPENIPFINEEEVLAVHENFAIAKFIRFLKHIGLTDMLEAIPDARQQSKCTYSHCSLLLWALSVFFFRQSSKNSLQSTIDDLSLQKRNSLLRYMDISVDSLPSRTSVDDFLKTIDPEEINNILMKLFWKAKRSKMFDNHAEKLLPNNHFHLGTDGFYVHKYSTPHVVDENGQNACPYCLSRTHNKGKDDEKTYWLHAFVTFVLIFPGGVKFPIYVYPLKAVQVNLLGSNEKLKQECELVALYHVLPILKERLGRIKITMLDDSLYANEPVIKLADSLKWNYLIVRKPGSLPSIGAKCAELEKTDLYKNHYQASQKVKLDDGSVKEISAQWFNGIDVGEESSTNVLRFDEVVKNRDGSVVSHFHSEWLSATQIQQGNWHSLAERGRMRSAHEDMHNTLKRRGFAASHDYARSNHSLWLIWSLLMYVGFFIFELFGCTTIARDACGKRSWMKFARDLLQQLVEVVWEKICLSECLQKTRIQFRYDFSPE
jgi:hypothetical protein